MGMGVRLTRAVGLAAVALAALPAGAARAQYGFGGYGFGYYYSPALPEPLLNSWALQNGAKATMGPKQNNVYENNPNAYINHLHDDGYLSKYDVSSRREMEASIGRYSDGPPPSRVAASEHAPPPPPRTGSAPAPPAPPSLPLSSFFDRYQKLVWPDGSPDFGGLATKRTAADQACLAVLNDYNLRGLAGVGTVTEARSKVVEYGRPALEYVRNNSTPRVADSFHLFLLSLYESLAQAATVPKPATPAPATAPAAPTTPRP